jgi:NAD(P)-dependent dehydrogenase (short-subunit alcohol dehydrogenase family)
MEVTMISDWRLDGVRVVVTGASSGLGKAMAVSLLEAGAEVALASRPSNRLEHTYSTLKEKGLLVHKLEMDVRNEESVKAAALWVRKNWDHLDLVVNNAGIGMITVNPRFLQEPRPFFEVSSVKFKDLFDTNVLGYFLVSSVFSRLFIEQKRGRFVNISINRQTMTRNGFVPYGPSRAASEAMSYVMAEDLRPYGIAVNILLPGGLVLTGMVPEDLSEERKKGAFDAKIMGAPIVFLASKESEGLTGQRIVASEFASWLSNFRSSHPKEWFL